MRGPVAARSRARLQELGGEAGRTLHVVDALAANVPLWALPELAEDPDVFWISPDRKVRPSMSVAAASAGAAPFRSSGSLTGAGVTIVLIDSGIAAHEDLPSFAGYVDFIEPNTPFSRDRYGHGTHAAGIIAGAHRPEPGGSGRLLGGIAPGADLISLRVLDRNGEGYVSDVIEAIGWAIANKNAYGIRILNISLGHPVAEPSGLDPLVAACEKAWAAGLVVVTSAGNLGLHGNGTITSPGNASRILTVGAFADGGTEEASDDAVSAFSSRGPTLFDLTVKPDLIAPGQGIVSLRATHSTLDIQHPEARVSVGDGPPGSVREPRYFTMSGSSMAAALVSGAVALMLEEEPALTPDTVKARLMAAARRMNDASVFDRGAGAVDAVRAVDHSGIAMAAVSPPVYEADGLVHIDDLSVVWGGTGSWSLESIYGDPVFWGTDLIWQNGFLSDPCVTGDGIIWQGRKIKDDGLSGDGIIWQGRKIKDDGLSGEGIIWQGLTASGGEPAAPPALDQFACTSGAGIIWQGRKIKDDGLSGDGIIWQGRKIKDDGLSGEGIIWQGRSGP